MAAAAASAPNLHGIGGIGFGSLWDYLIVGDGLGGISGGDCFVESVLAQILFRGSSLVS